MYNFLNYYAIAFSVFILLYICVWDYCRWSSLLHWVENFAPISQIQLHYFTYAPLGTFHHTKWSWSATVSRMMWAFFNWLQAVAYKGLLYTPFVFSRCIRIWKKRFRGVLSPPISFPMYHQSLQNQCHINKYLNYESVHINFTHSACILFDTVGQNLWS